jgi:tetratricopeptide (TPR) repeat protein
LSFTREIIERRVLPAAGVYVGACWVVVEILDRLAERYYLSPYLTDIIFWGLFSLLPAVILLAWTHGRPGRDKATRTEKVGIPLNVILTAGMLLTVFGDKDISVTADLVTMANELGQEEVHYIPRESYRRRIAVFFWDQAGDDADSEWLQYGVTELLTQDLRQNPFLLVSSPWDNPVDGFYPEMSEAGFDDGLGVPLTLKREIAEQANRDYFIDGEISREDQQFTISARVWDTASLEMIDEISARGWNLMGVVDELADGVRELLDTPPGRGDLPLGEAYGESEDTLRNYISAMNAVLFENDREKAIEFYDRALNADPGFALAWYMKSVTWLEQGNTAGTQSALEEAQKLSYRLPERDQITVKLMTYRIAGEQEKVETLLRMQTQIIGDASSYHRLAVFLMLSGEPEEAKEQFRRQMEVDSSSISTLLQLARLDRATGDLDAAISNVLRYIDERPEDFGAHLMLGDLYLEAGDMESARDYYERAQIIEDPPLTATIKLALLAIGQGEWNRARGLIGEAREVATSARQVVMALQVEAYLEQRLGRIGVVIELLEEMAVFSKQALSPVEHVFTYNEPLVQQNIFLNRLDEAESVLLSAQQALQPPLDKFLSFVEVVLYAQKGDIERAEASLEAGIEVIEHFKADYVAFAIPVSAAVIAEAKGDFSQAGRYYAETIQKLKQSVFAGALQQGQSLIYGACAQAHVKAGELELAQSVLDYAFKRDGAEPTLWVARAMLQEAKGTPHMALASINYALAIWAEADPEYVWYQKALKLKQQLKADSQ